MTGLPEIVLPLALGGALVAGISLTGRGRPERGPGRDASRGARWARRRDLRPLRVAAEGAPPGRLLLGVLPGVARLTGLAAETAQSLVVVGPTQSGKTTSLAVPAILGWRGPVLAASVKSDLLRHTLGDAGAPRAGVVHRPDRLHGRTGQHLVTADRLRRVA